MQINRVFFQLRGVWYEVPHDLERKNKEFSRAYTVDEEGEFPDLDIVDFIVDDEKEPIFLPEDLISVEDFETLVEKGDRIHIAETFFILQKLKDSPIEKYRDIYSDDGIFQNLKLPEEKIRLNFSFAFDHDLFYPATEELFTFAIVNNLLVEENDDVVTAYKQNTELQNYFRGVLSSKTFKRLWLTYRYGDDSEYYEDPETYLERIGWE